MERIRLDRITKIYDLERVVTNFSLSVDAGEFCVVLGPSGSGKSTILNVIGGFTAPTSGEIYVDGIPITGLRPHQRNLGMMLQGYALFPHLTVFENVAFPLRARGFGRREVRDKVERMLAVVELDKLSARLPNELSGGQQQRTALARALVFEPRLLLMDEPLAALDRHLRERMQSEIRAVQRKLAITVIYITHDQREAMVLADKLVVMKHGQIEQIGEPLDVYWRPQTRFVCEFLGDSNLLDASVEAVEHDTAHCRTAAGTLLSVRVVDPPVIGDSVVVAIRPERMRFAADRGLESNRLRGRVLEIVDVGVSRRYLIKVSESEEPLLISEQGKPSRSEIEIEEEIGLTFEREDAVLVRR